MIFSFSLPRFKLFSRRFVQFDASVFLSRINQSRGRQSLNCIKAVYFFYLYRNNSIYCHLTSSKTRPSVFSRTSKQNPDFCWQYWKIIHQLDQELCYFFIAHFTNWKYHRVKNCAISWQTRHACTCCWTRWRSIPLPAVSQLSMGRPCDRSRVRPSVTLTLESALPLFWRLQPFSLSSLLEWIWALAPPHSPHTTWKKCGMELPLSVGSFFLSALPALFL